MVYFAKTTVPGSCLPLLHGGTTAQIIQNLAQSLREWAIHRATAGALVATATKALGYVRHIQRAFTAKAHAKASIGNFAEQCRHFHFSNGEHIVHQSFTIFFDRSTTLHLFLRDPCPANASLGIQIAQSFTEEPHLR